MAHINPIVEALDILRHKIGDLAQAVLVEERLADVSLHDLFVLGTILTLEQPTASQLAETLRVTRPTITAVIKKLVAQGYVKRVQSAEDGRAYHISLTDQGTQIAQLHTRVHERIAAYLGEVFDDQELAQLVTLLTRLVNHTKQNG